MPRRSRSIQVVVTAVAVVGLSLLLRAQPPDPLPAIAPAAARVDPAALAAGREVLERAVGQQSIAGAVAMLVRDGRTVWSTAVGVQDLQSRVPMSDRSLFRIYSMTKPVTAVAVMMLAEQGRFRLDDPVKAYLPEFENVVVRVEGGATRPPARPVTVRDLLLHTSGLEHRTAAIYRDAQVRSRSIPLPQFIRNIAAVPLMEDPGTRFRYSEATTVLGRLVEVWSGEPFDQFLQRRVFAPLGMRDTTFYVAPEQRARLATVYGPADGGGLRPVEVEALPFTERPALIEGSVGLVSTVPDFARFAQMLIRRGALGGTRLLAAATVYTMVVNSLPPEVVAARGNGAMGWGLGNVDVVLKPELLRYPASAGEYGWDGTAGTIFWNDPDMKTTLLLFTQSAPANPDGIRQRFKAAVQPGLRP